MLRLKWVYEPAAPRGRLARPCRATLAVEARKGSAAIDSWEKQVAPSAELNRWFGGRRSRWAGFRTRYALELRQHRERAAAVKRPVTRLFSARDCIHNSAAVLRDVLCRGLELDVDATKMSRAELLMFLNRLLAGSRATVKEAKSILQGTGARMLDIQRDESYASAIIIQLVKSLGGRPDHGIGSIDDTRRVRRARVTTKPLWTRSNPASGRAGNGLLRVADDRVRHRLQKRLITRLRNLRRLEGKSQLA
jgi:uncharacterized protein YeaO (DUF488 family)